MSPVKPISYWAVILRLHSGAWSVAWANRRKFLIVFAILGVSLLALHSLDHPIMDQLATWRTENVVQWAQLISLLGELHIAPLIIVAGVWAWAEWRRNHQFRIPLIASVLAMLTSGVLVLVLKKIIGRPRPHLPVPDQFDWFHPTWNSFPSGHAMHWSALIGALWILSPRLAIAATPLALIVMTARLLVPRHYPTDLLAGAVLGLLCGICFGLAARKLTQTSTRLPDSTHHE